jgi:hypothetical protein
VAPTPSLSGSVAALAPRLEARFARAERASSRSWRSSGRETYEAIDELATS